MDLKDSRNWMMVAGSAALQVLCFPIAGQVPAWRSALGWICLVPWLWVLTEKTRTSWKDGRSAFLLSYACGTLWYLASCSWIFQTMNLYGGLDKAVSLGILLLFSLYLGLYHACFGLLVWLARISRLGARGALMLAPFLWVAVELARARVTGFPWDLLGYTQVGNSLVNRLAPVVGVMGMSWLVAVVNAAVVMMVCWRAMPASDPAGGLAGGMAGGVAGGRARLVRVAGLLGIVLVMEMVGDLVPRSSAKPSERAVLVQENLAVGATAGAAEAAPAQRQAQVFGGLALHPETPMTPDGPSPQEPTTVVLLPEAPNRFVTSDPVFRASMGALARAAQAPVIAGAEGVEQDAREPDGYREYVSAAEFTRDGSYGGRYDKIRLVPWGEYVPYKELFRFASSLTGGVSNFARGRTRGIFHADGHAYGVFLCYESIFGDEVRQFVQGGAQVLVNLSDDGWYGDTGAPWQHLNMARMRALENHRWVLRDTNTGETTVIDPWGQYTLTPRHVRTAYQLPFGFEQGQTLYTRWGDWWAWVSAAVSLAALGWGWVGSGRIRNQQRAGSR